MWIISGAWEGTPLISFGPLDYMIIYLNKPYIIRYGGELSNIEYLPTKPENAENLWNVKTGSYHLF
jgi:hypothetical protein